MDVRKQRKILFLNMGIAALLVSVILLVIEVNGAVAPSPDRKSVV
jgi:hypothetical protein